MINVLNTLTKKTTMHSIVDVIQNGQVFDVLLNTTLAKSVCPNGFSGALCGITEKKSTLCFILK
jgi:hypothetical protein